MKFSAYIRTSVIIAVFSVLLGGALLYLFSADYTLEEDNLIPDLFVEAQPNFKFGINVDSLEITEGVIKRNQFLADILLPYNVSYEQITALAKADRSNFDVRKMSAGDRYMVISKKDSARTIQYFVYQQSKVDYVVCDLRDSICVYRGAKEIERKKRTTQGVVTSSLYQTLIDAKSSPLLALELASIYAWTIDFYGIQNGDYFKVVYEELFVEGESIGIGKIKAALFNHYGEDFFAFLYENEEGDEEYFDEKGNSLRKTFLKSPLKYSRMTSGFNYNRFHPVQKKWKAHLGTDYAAPTGTPIMSTGDGIVVEATYTKNNGNYVKIKHNSVYITQYLHMSKIDSRSRPGVKVKQGDIIGYVGSTGLATGPHVCYRFWKHGSQVNHLKEKFPSTNPVEKDKWDDFVKIKSIYEPQLKENSSLPDTIPKLANLNATENRSSTQ